MLRQQSDSMQAVIQHMVDQVYMQEKAAAI